MRGRGLSPLKHPGASEGLDPSNAASMSTIRLRRLGVSGVVGACCSLLPT